MKEALIQGSIKLFSAVFTFFLKPHLVQKLATALYASISEMSCWNIILKYFILYLSLQCNKRIKFGKLALKCKGSNYYVFKFSPHFICELSSLS